MNRRRFIIGALIAVVALAVTYWLARVAHPFGLQAWMIKEQSLRVFVWSVRDLFRYSVLTPAFLVFIALTLTLQRSFPAKPNQAILNVRYHILEYIVRHTWLVIPFLMLQVDPPQIVWFSIIAKWYTRFYHGNIRTNLGPLRYVLVTPQFHRIHHSVERRHRDTNFGALFSIWDRLFGTQYRGYDEYPETGIEDEAFPHEKVAGVTSLLLRPLVRMVYPFRQTQEQYAASPSIRQRAPDRAAREA